MTDTTDWPDSIEQCESLVEHYKSDIESIQLQLTAHKAGTYEAPPEWRVKASAALMYKQRSLTNLKRYLGTLRRAQSERFDLEALRIKERGKTERHRMHAESIPRACLKIALEFARDRLPGEEMDKLYEKLDDCQKDMAQQSEREAQ